MTLRYWTLTLRRRRSYTQLRTYAWTYQYFPGDRENARENRPNGLARLARILHAVKDGSLGGNALANG